MATVKEIEEKIMAIENILVVIRADSSTQIDEFEYRKKAAGNTTISSWLETRVKPIIKGHEVIVISGDSVQPHGLTKLEKLRNTYT